MTFIRQMTGCSIGDALYILQAVADFRRGVIRAPRNRNLGSHATNDVGTWGRTQVASWLSSIGIGQFAQLFDEHAINGDVLLDASISELSPIDDAFFDLFDVLESTIAALHASGIVESLAFDYSSTHH